MAMMHSSTGMQEPMPARAISAEEKAMTTPPALRFTQGISTRPATGSQTRPSWLAMATAQASAHCEGVPPDSSTMAAAVMPAALPHSAWQPPWAPAMQAFLAMTIPKAAAVNMLMTTSLRSMPLSSMRVRRQPGMMPQLPATMRPMEALQPDTERARIMARLTILPERPPLVSVLYTSIL